MSRSGFRPSMRFCANMLPGLALALVLPLGVSRAQEPPPPLQYKLKAAFLYHFAQFVEWPAGTFAESNSPLVIAVLGENPFGEELERTIRGKLIDAHPCVIREIRSAAEARTNCHLLFISSSEKSRLPEIIESLRGVSVLTVSETDGFTETGGMINFVPQGKKIRFKINDDAAKSARLKIQAKLLSLGIDSAP